MIKKIHIVSLSHWNEPRRIRKQLAELLMRDYELVYHSPYIISPDGEDKESRISFDKLPFIKKYSSIPVVSVINALMLFIYLKKSIRHDDVLINFIPEALLFFRPSKLKILSLINDDYSLTVKPIFSRWVRFLLKRMSKKSDHTLFVSNSLLEKYKSKNSILFHPWADKADYSAKRPDKDVILYWGYIGHTLDYELIENMARQIEDESLKLKIMLAGPVSKEYTKKVISIVNSHPCISYHSPTEKLEDLEIDRVLFGIEPLSKNYRNGSMVEMPNKAPRFLAHGIPIVYSGCVLLDQPFFIQYNGDLKSMLKDMLSNAEIINNSIDGYFKENNSRSRLDLLDKLISGKSRRNNI